MEESILSSLTKTVPKTRPTNIKTPGKATKQDKVAAFAPSASKKKLSLIEKSTKCSISETILAKLFSDIESAEAPTNEDYEI